MKKITVFSNEISLLLRGEPHLVSHCGRDGHCSFLLKGFRSIECNKEAVVTLKQFGVCNDLGSFKKEIFLRTVLHFFPRYSEQLVVYTR